MKRNNELMAKILLEIEKRPFKGGCHDIEIEGYAEEETSYHVRLLHQMGLVDAIDFSSHDGPAWKAKDLTPLGHDFLDAVRNKGLWSKFITTMKEEGPRVIVLEALRQAIIRFMNQGV